MFNFMSTTNYTVSGYCGMNRGDTGSQVHSFVKLQI